MPPNELPLCFIQDSFFNEEVGFELSQRLPGNYMYGVTQHATRSLMLRALAACMDAAGGWIYTDKQYEKCHLEYIEVHESSLDRSTLASLEVISNQQTGRQDGSLLGLFKTCTKVGKDLLTETLKAPLTSKRMIEQRFDFLEELRRNDDEALNEITRVLKTQKGLQLV